MKLKPLLVAAMLISSLFSAGAVAQRASPGRKELAKAIALYKAKKYDKTLRVLERALQLAPHGTSLRVEVTLRVAMALYHRGNYGLAWKAFEEALYVNPKLNLPPGEPKAMKRFFARIKPRVLARGGPTRAPFGKPLPVPVPKANGMRTGAWICTMVAVTAVATGVLFGTNAALNSDRASTFVQEARSAGLSSDHVTKVAQDLHSSAKSQAMGANVAFGVAGAAAAGAVVLFILSRKRGKAKAKKTAGLLVPSGMPLGFGLRF